MADLATLGIAVDSSSAEQGAMRLEKLSNAAKRAEAATKGVTTGARGAASAAAAVSSSSDSAAAALDREAAAARRAAQAMNAHAVAVNDNARRMSGSMSGLAAQFQDIGVTAAMGMNPAIIALQQGTQIAGQMEYAMQGGASATSVLGDAFRSLFSPLTFITIALTALAAVGLQMVDWPAAAAYALDALAAAIEVIAPYATAAAAGLALLYSPAIIGGIVQVIALLGRMTVAALSAAASLALANPAGAFVLGVTAAVAAANIFRDELAQIFGRDIVADAKNAVNFIIGAFVGAYNGVMAAWGKLPAAFGDLAAKAGYLFADKLREWINEAILLVDSFIKMLNEKFGSSIARPSVLAPLSPPESSGAASDVMGIISGEMQRAQGTDYVGQVTDAIAHAASAASGKLKELAEWMTKVDEKGAKKRGGKTEAERYQDIVDGANRRIATLQAEQAALGLTDYEAAKLAYTTDLLNQAQQKGITLTAAQRAELETLAGTMASIEVATEKAREAMDFAKDVTKGFFDDFRSGIEQGKGIWRSFGDAALNVLDKIVDKLLNDVLDALFRVNQAGGGGGVLGFLGGLLGGGGGGGFTPFEVAFTGLPGLWANGGYTGPGGKYEPAGVVHKGEYVFSAAATRALGVVNLDRMHRRARGYADGGYVGLDIPRMQSPANQNGTVVQIIDQRRGGTIEQQETIGPSGERQVRLIVRDEMKQAGVGDPRTHAALHEQAISERYLK